MKRDKVSAFMKSNTFYIIVSVAFAIVAWLLVLSSQNPTETRTIEVPITFINRNVLAEQDLVDTSITTQPSKVTVKVKGAEAFIEQIQPSDIYVEADYSQITEAGQATIKISEPVVDGIGVSVESYYPTEFECIYDKKIEKYIDVDVEWSDDLAADGVSIVDAQAEPSNILITGFSMLLDQVKSVKVNLADTIKKGSVTNDGSISLVCRFYNEDGDDISYNFDTEKVVVRYTTGKIIPISYTITDNPANGYYVESDKISTENAIISGTKEKLDLINKINLGQISVAGANATFTKKFDISDKIPADVILKEPAEVTVTISIAKYETKEISINPDKLRKIGENSSYTYKYSLDTTKVVVRGAADKIKDLQEGAVSYSVDVSNAKKGVQNLDIRFNLPEGISTQGTYRCRVEVSEHKGATDAPEVTSTPEHSFEPTSEPDN